MLINFEDVMSLNNCALDQKSGNYRCPFCEHMSFRVYPDAKAKCHSSDCGWSGNGIKFHADKNKLSYDEAVKALGIEYKKGTIKLQKLTFEQAKDDVAYKLMFFSWVRMYFKFHKGNRLNQKHYAKLSGLNESTFTKALDGRIDLLSVETINLVYAVLSSGIDIEQFKKDVFDKEFQKRKIDENGWNNVVKKFMN